MADALIFEFGADITKFTGNVQQVIDQIKKVREEIKTASAGDLPKLNAQLATLTEGLKRLKTVGTPAADGFKKVEDNAKGARVALTSVNQVVQDLPFGFIGIQNNLPALFQSFSKLNSSTEGIVGSFKNLDKATLITSGLFLAFNVATAAVTFLIQKYGSLGAAFDALFGKTNLAAKAQQEYNKALAQSIGSSATESAEIVILTNVLLDLNKPLKERQAAYVELTKISPDVVAGISQESIATGAYTTLLYDNATAIIQLLKLKAEEAAISNILTKNAEELATLKIEESKLLKEQASAQRDLDKAKKEGILVLGAGRNADQLAIIAINDAAKSLKENKLEQNNLNKVANDYIKLLDPTIRGIAEIDRRTKSLNDTLKESQKVRKEPKEPKAPKVPKPAKEKKGLDILDLERRARIATQKLQDRADKNRLRFLAEQLKTEEKLTKEFWKQQDAIMNADANAFTKKTLGTFGFLDIELVQQNLDNARLAFQKAYEDLNLIFFEPLQNLFNELITKGVVNFKDFGDAVLKTLTQIASKIIASGILKLLASLMTGGAAGIAKAGLSTIGTSGLAAFLGGTGAANFSGVQGGGMGMSGSVNLTLRGSDLVGAINRTNSQISRVG